VKRKNPINEPLFVPPLPESRLNPYARIIIDEARRRGIGVEIIDDEYGYFRLRMGGRSIVCRESLAELTSAAAMSLCDDKRLTHRGTVLPLKASGHVYGDEIDRQTTDRDHLEVRVDHRSSSAEDLVSDGFDVGGRGGLRRRP
jgi:hypothetical protein